MLYSNKLGLAIEANLKSCSTMSMYHSNNTDVKYDYKYI